MNKNVMLPLVALMVLAMVGAASAADTVIDKVEIRGNVVNLSTTQAADIEWNCTTFAAFWYDIDDNLMTENLTILENIGNPTLSGAAGSQDREIDENALVYMTHPEYQEYELYENEGLVVEGDSALLSSGYYLEGWLSEKYVAVNNNADKLAKLLVEFEDDDKKTLATGEAWDLGGGFTLTAQQIDLEGEKCWLTLEKDGKELDSEVVSTGAAAPDKNDSVYTYTADIANEDDIPVFSCYVDAVFRGTDTNIVQVMYVFLMDTDVLEIETSETYGAMEVMTASKTQIVLRNDETTLDLDEDTIEHIMGNMYFRTADNIPGDGALRFYPYVEYTIGEIGEVTEDEGAATATATVTETVGENVTGPGEEGEGVGEGEGEGEVVATATATTEAEAEPTETEAEPTATKKKVPGFEALFAISGLLAVAYLVLRQRD